MSVKNNAENNKESYAQSRAEDGVTQQTPQGMQKATLFFCVFTSGLLGVFAWLMTQINHSPWGLVGAAIIVLTLTAQQAMRKPQNAVAEIIETSHGVSNLSRGASNLSRGASNLSRGAA